MSGDMKEGYAPRLQPYTGSPIIPVPPGHWILHDRCTGQDRLLRTPLKGWMRCLPAPVRPKLSDNPTMLAAVSSNMELFEIESISLELPDGTVNDGLRTYPTLADWINRRFGMATPSRQRRRAKKRA